jgi:hypothetical protein
MYLRMYVLYVCMHIAEGNALLSCKYVRTTYIHIICGVSPSVWRG